MQISKAIILSSLFVIPLILPKTTCAAPSTWAEGEEISHYGRPDPLDIGVLLRQQSQLRGQAHALQYPVTVTGILPPYEPIKNLLENQTQNPLKHFLNKLVKGLSGYRSFHDLTAWLGLHDFPEDSATGIYGFPRPDHVEANMQIGISTMERNGELGFTISCAACHVGQLFGRPIMGLTNRFPRANEFFIRGKKAIQLVSPKAFQFYAGATDVETEMFRSSKENMNRVQIKSPLVLGLDTSLAQVSLSLSTREDDQWATPSRNFETHPRANWLDQHPADSKPAVWWNVKYKNRWLSDGSVVSGNPIYTNILWNEIGRGVSLPVLQYWLSENPKIIEDLTNAVFSAQAPPITDFFPADKIDLASAKRGESLFNETCSRCHGVYEKAWNGTNSNLLNKEQILRTTRVRYFSKTPVMNVGTDPWRAAGMKALEPLNNLQISKNQSILIRSQNGYVPPPLEGIWARWPYFHNNSAPSLCAVLTKSSERPTKYWAGEANNKETDFDFECNGYPEGDAVPTSWKKDLFLYDSSRRGMNHSGHDEGIFLENGNEILSSADKRDLISFLQTL